MTTDISPAEITNGIVIDYRGFPATVMECWTVEEDAIGRFWNPIGAVIEWVDEHGNRQRTRLLWPVLDANEDLQLRHRLQRAQISGDEVEIERVQVEREALLQLCLETDRVKLWQG